MPASGVVATKEDVNAFTDSCVLLRSQWEHFQILFEGSDLKRDLLQTTAPIFFDDLHRLFVEHFVQHICRLTDNAQTGNKKNLTVSFLIEHSDFSSAPDKLDKLRALSVSIHGFRELIVEARNKFISHLDLEAARLGEPRGAASMEKWWKFWIDLQDFLDIMHTHHVRADHHFYLNGIGKMSDADSLLGALRNAQLFYTALSDHEITTRVMAAADKSKFAANL